MRLELEWVLPEILFVFSAVVQLSSLFVAQASKDFLDFVFWMCSLIYSVLKHIWSLTGTCRSFHFSTYSTMYTECGIGIPDVSFLAYKQGVFPPSAPTDALKVAYSGTSFAPGAPVAVYAFLCVPGV